MKNTKRVLILSLLFSNLGLVNAFAGESGVINENKASINTNNNKQIWLKDNQKEWVWKNVQEKNNNIEKYVPTNFSPYVIQKGDSLWSISEKFRVSITDLLKWNNISENTTILPGQEILIKVDQISWVLDDKTSNDNNFPSDAQAVKVKNGEIWVWKNKNPNSKILPEKNEDFVPTNFSPYYVLENDSLWSISKKFNVSLNELRKWNDLNENSILYPGDVLLIKVDELSYVWKDSNSPLIQK